MSSCRTFGRARAIYSTSKVRRAQPCVVMCVAHAIAHLRRWGPTAFVNNAHVVMPAVHALLVSLHSLSITKLGYSGASGDATLDTVEGWQCLFLKCAAFNVLRLQQKGTPMKNAPWEQVFCLERVRDAAVLALHGVEGDPN